MNSLFGTDGIRGPVNTGIFVVEKLHKLGHAIGRWAFENYGSQPTIIMGSDTRHSASWIKRALTAGLASTTNRVFDAGTIPTPLAAYVLHERADVALAIIISASHNPADDNGLKIIKRSGKLTEQDEVQISAYYQEEYHYAPVAGDIQQIDYPHHLYTQKIRAWFKHLHIPHRRIVLDAAHGAVTPFLVDIFSHCGAEIIIINAAPDGYNINALCGSTHPSSLCEAVLLRKADIGFAFDGDGDRVIAVNRQGVLKDGDDLLCMLLDHPDYQKITTVVGTIMTNAGLETHMRARGINLIRTAVGDKHITNALDTHNLMLGGEPAGHIILRNRVTIGDGMLVALTVLETLRITDNWDFITFKKQHQAQSKIALRTRTYNLAAAPFSTLINQAERWVPGQRILVRYSGTEPVIRIMVEGPEEASVEQTCQQLTQNLTQLFEERHL